MATSAYAYKRGPKRARAPRQHPELDFQKQVAKYLTYALPPDWRSTASAAGVPLPPKVARDLVEAGQNRGWSDMILRQVGTGEARWLELKAGRNKLTPEQEQFRDDCPQNFAEARTLSDVEAALLRWGIVPRCDLAGAKCLSARK